MIYSMRYRIAVVLIALLTVSGCGSFYHAEQTYYVQQSGRELVAGKSDPNAQLIVQLVPSTKTTKIPFFYHSRKWGAPYSIRFAANTRATFCTYFLIHSMKLKSGEFVIVDKTYTTPLKLDVCEKKYMNNHELLVYPLGDSLQFEKGKIVELQVNYELPDIGKKSITLSGIGKEEKRKSSLFDAYMGI